MADEQDPSSGSPDTAVDAADQAVLNGDQAAFKEVRLAQRAGKPVPTILPTPADPAPAPPVEQAASTEAPKAASEPAKPKKNADTRVPELLADRERERAENARLRAEIETLKRQRPDAPPAESSPAAPTQEDWERFEAMSDAPKLDNFNDYQKWTVAMSAFVLRKGLEEYAQKQKQDYEEGRYKEAEARSFAKGKEEFPDFKEALDAAGAAGRRWPREVIEFLITNEHGYRVAHALAKAKDDDAVYQRIGTAIGFGMYAREVLAQYEAPKQSVPVPRKTSAPDPPFTLGSRPHDAADEEEAALAAGDQSAFKAIRLAKRANAHR